MAVERNKRFEESQSIADPGFNRQSRPMLRPGESRIRVSSREASVGSRMLAMRH
jgi:hypothetical protein